MRLPQRSRLLVPALVVAAVVAVPAEAQAGGWSAPAVLESACANKAMNCAIEPAPRVAVNARGQSAVAWVDRGGRVRAALGDARGHFTGSTRFEQGFRPAVSLAADGTVVVVWSRSGLLRFVRRGPGHGFSTPRTLVPRGSKEGDDSPKAAIQPDGATLVVYENAYRAPGYVTRLRTVRISRAGRTGRMSTLGYGSILRDGFRAAPSGSVAVCCLRPAGSALNGPIPAPGVVARYAPSTGWSTLTPPLVAPERIETVAPGRADVAIGTVDAVHSGDAGVSGTPGLMRADEQGVFGPLLQAPVTRPGYALGPVAAIDNAGRSVLVYQEKSVPKAFSRVAPIYAVSGPAPGPFGTRQTLDAGNARLPALLAYRTGALAAWEAPHNRWGVAVERGGRFARVPAPPGGPSNVGEDFNFSRGMAASGRYAALTWTARDGSVRVSLATAL